jgi:hypothetical protein
MRLIHWLRGLLLIAIGLILPDYLLDPDPPWWRRYDR